MVCITKEWYTDICRVFLKRSLLYVLTTGSFLSVMLYFQCISVWCTTIVVWSHQAWHLRLRFVPLMDDCLLRIQHPNMYKNLFIGLLDRGQVDRLWKRLVAFLDYDDMLILILKIIMLNEFLFVNSIPTHHDDNFCYWNTFWEGQIKIFYIQKRCPDWIGGLFLACRCKAER